MSSSTHDQTTPPAGTDESHLGRRRFLTYLVAGPTLAVAARFGVDSAGGGAQAEAAGLRGAVIPTLPGPADLLDLGDVLILGGAPTSGLLIRIDVAPDGKVTCALPREEVGQGITTAVAMVIAEELSTPLENVTVTLADARPELLLGQLTGGSNTIRSVYMPVRTAAAAARARLVGAAAQQWGVPAAQLSTRNGTVVSANGRVATYGSLTAAAASPSLPVPAATLKAAEDFTLVRQPTPRKDARAMVTGAMKYTLDADVPGALPAMVRRGPSIKATVRSIQNEAAIRAMPGILALAVVPNGVAVVGETFGQVLDAKEALEVTWNAGTIDNQNNDTILAKLKAATLPLVVPPLLSTPVDGEFSFASAPHAPMETNTAIADVRSDRAEIWAGLKSPIVAQQTIAGALGLPQDKVTVHVIQGGGSFGRRLFFDSALEAAQISKAVGKPVKLLWTRVDDMRHGRTRAPSFHRVRATFALGQVLSFEHRVTSAETDFGHGLGEILTATAAQLPVGGNVSFSQTVFLTTIKSPYNFGVTTQLLNEVPVGLNTASWRSVFSANTRGVEEIMVDRIAAKLRKDPAAFRREHLKTDRQRAVLDKVVQAGQWGKAMPRGFAQGIAFHDEYKSCTAILVEIDARDPAAPRVTKAVIAGDYGLAINPKGLESQLLGGLSDAIGTTLRAGLHIDKGLPLEGSYSQFHYTRQADSPRDVQIHILQSSDEPGGAGELGVPAAVGAIANAYTRATGRAVSSFPINFPVDFEPFPRGAGSTRVRVPAPR